MSEIRQPDLPDRARQIEREAGPGATHHELAEAFGRACQALPEGHPHREPLTQEAWLYQYELPSQPPERPADEPFMPFWTTNDGRQHPPRVADYPAGAIEHFRARLQTTENPSARARLADFLWQRTREIGYADTAIDSYIAAALACPPSEPGLVPVQYILRASILTRSLGRDRPDLRMAIESLAQADNRSYLSPLVLATAGEIARDQDLANRLVAGLIGEADAAAVQGGQQRGSERHALLAAITLSSATRDHATAKALKERRARSFEYEAVERAVAGPLIQTFLLQDAMTTFGELGMRDDLERVKSRLHEASRQASENLGEVAVEQTIPTAELEADVEQLMAKGKERSPWWHLQMLAVRGLWPNWSEIARQTERLAQEAPIQALARQVILGPDGRPYERPSDPEAAQRFNEIRTYVQKVQFQLALWTVQVAMMRERGGWSATLIVDALRAGVLFPPESLTALQPGIEAYEAGRHWEAVHVLVPQIERAVRQLALGLGEDVYRYVPATGEIHWSSLKRLLWLEGVRAILGRLRPDVADELGYLLIDSRGLNLRDDVAHGIMPASDNMEGPALLCVLILLTLSILARRTSEPGTSGGSSQDPGTA